MRTRTIKAALLGSAALATVAGSFTTIFASTAAANPLSATVTTGSASVALSPNKTQIDQKSEDVVIDWPSFNIGAGQTTQFVQPNTLAIAVNRIGGNAPSQILGTLDANGRIVLINGNGMLFGKGAQVNVGSIVATSTDGTDSGVLAGKFTQGGKQNVSVINQGRITTSQDGLVALVAPSVTNSGTVNAKFGIVAVGAANKFTGVILNGANKIADLGAFTNAGGGGFALTDGRTLTINGAVDGGTGDMSLQSGGNIDIDGAITDGGTVTLTSGGAIAEGNGGSISAASLAGSGSAATKLHGANQIATLDDFTNLHGNMSLTDDEGLTVEGSVNTGKKNLTLQTSNGDLQITGSIDGGTITLDSALGEVDGTGAITAYILNVTANTGIDLTGPNAIKKLGTNQTNSGPDVIDGVK